MECTRRQDGDGEGYYSYVSDGFAAESLSRASGNLTQQTSGKMKNIIEGSLKEINQKKTKTKKSNIKLKLCALKMYRLQIIGKTIEKQT